MKIEPNYMYRVMGDLEKEGRVKSPQGRPRRTSRPSDGRGSDRALDLGATAGCRRGP